MKIWTKRPPQNRNGGIQRPKKAGLPGGFRTCSKTNAAWLVAYLVGMALLVMLLREIRQNVLVDFDTPTARAHWQTWKSEASRQTEKSAPVERRAPTADEPPVLMLMRDHFASVLGGGILFGTCLFLMAMFAIRGVMSPSPAGD